ncbi:hypothetical protein HPB50_024822 [Hyalomma asiaticum]|uniref:Uncharacterized protein n=1 Tax=Hyalomma asiaticum TaxID=266040 RepID=A0ACB7TQN7_HYAAI|nr:hypothetical protein HPB50_024822 [Hyalomma asiaticum]
MQNDRSNVSLLIILGVGRSWFEGRDRLLPRRPAATSGPQTWPPKYLWTAYVAFVTCLVSTLNQKSRNPMAPSVPRSYTLQFAEILCGCCEIMVQSVAHDVAAEVVCLRHVFTSVGSFLATSSPRCMAVLARCIRGVLRNPRLQEAAQSAFQDVPELQALAWKYAVP